MTSSHRPRLAGLFADDSTGAPSLWIRETGSLGLPALKDAAELVLEGEVRPTDPADATAGGGLGLEIRIDGRTGLTAAVLPVGPFALR
ncbi:MAG: hypothetical protein ACHQ5A_07650, partial [Opitutales bacterium]